MVIGVRAFIATFLLLPALCAAAIKFPTLSGRVVDNAGMLSAATEQTLTQKLAAHEQQTTNQIVVATLPDLQGYTIEEFGYQLGRHWGIGQKKKDNGVLLLVAKAERKVRIEVGYGLEGTLTDALSSNIIHGVILPQFKRGDFENGVSQGLSAIIQALGGKYKYKKVPRESIKVPPPYNYLLSTLILYIFLSGFFSGGRRRRHSWLWGAGHGNLGRSGGFRGGGGRFGGGGSSGGW